MMWGWSRDVEVVTATDAGNTGAMVWRGDTLELI